MLKFFKRHLFTILWVLWLAMFAVLEYLGIRRDDDRAFTLTNRIRALMRSHPWARWIVGGAIVALLVWLFQHFILVDPVTNPGALL